MSPGPSGSLAAGGFVVLQAAYIFLQIARPSPAPPPAPPPPAPEACLCDCTCPEFLGPAASYALPHLLLAAAVGAALGVLAVPARAWLIGALGGLGAGVALGAVGTKRLKRLSGPRTPDSEAKWSEISGILTPYDDGTEAEGSRLVAAEDW